LNKHRQESSSVLAFLGDGMSSYAKSLTGGFCILALMGTAWAKEHPHVEDADREYAALFSHVENPCNESTTLGYEQCIGKEVEFTERVLDCRSRHPGR
jgi:hypothetical protein